MKVAIITPVKNEEDNLPTLIKSVKSQSIQPFAWVIVNDNSSDNSREIIEKETTSDDWIYLINKKGSTEYRMEENYGKVYVSSEQDLPEELKKYQLRVPVDKIHDVLYHANLFVGDSQTMTTEAAVLGTPAIRCSSFAGENDMTNFIELEKKYGLIFNYKDPEKAIAKAQELIKDPNLKDKWVAKRKKLLDDKIDLSSFLIWFIDNYPESVELLKKDKDYYLKVLE